MSTAAKNRRFTLTRPLCPQCVKLQEEVKRLRERTKSLEAQLRYQQRKIDEGYFGSSTPSSKRPFKVRAKATHYNGGACQGHQGHGRAAISAQEADAMLPIDIEHICPDCQVPLVSLGSRDRTVLEVEPVRVKRILYHLKRRRCPVCRQIFRAKAPDVLPKFKLSNSVLAHVATEHYLHQVTLGHLAMRLNINEGTLIDALHHLAQRFQAVPPRLIAEYRDALVKHADETGWPIDGRNGYAWIFVTRTITIFRLRRTRSASVVREVLGEKALLGALIVDRYRAYNKVLCFIQYCYAHLLRRIKDLGKEFPDHQEVQDFVNTAAPLLAQAIQLRTLPISDEVFYVRADLLKIEIQQVMHSEARHAGVQKIQNIFRENAHRLYHWAHDRSIPADNNFAERELRQLVIARKVSFGSQAEAGAKTRETLMTTLLTLKKRKPGDVWLNLKTCLDKLACDPNQDLYQLLFSSNTS
ncbi:MAG: IS66 family transposase [bacterium]